MTLTNILKNTTHNSSTSFLPFTNNAENKTVNYGYFKSKYSNISDLYKSNPNETIKHYGTFNFSILYQKNDNNNLYFDEFDTFLASEEMLKKDWLSPVEDEAWKDL